MFTATLQLIDLFGLGTLGLFLTFFFLSWTIHIIKLGRAAQYTEGSNVDRKTPVSIIIPVVDEPLSVWAQVLDSVKHAANGGRKYEVIVVANGASSEENADYAFKKGFKVLRLKNASKREAVKAGAMLAQYEITIILDSDTIFTEDAIQYMLSNLQDHAVGGVTPQQHISSADSNFWRRISNWLEDTRFNEVVAGQSVGGAVSCLPGRAFAIRTQILKGSIDGLVNQTFLGKPCISGDDRYLTSEILKLGYKTVYEQRAIVFTESPTTFEGFVKQRVRWSRTSLRETLRSLPWTFKYPYMAFSVLSTLIMRWLFFIVVINFALSLFGVTGYTHWLQLSPATLLFGTIAGFFASGFIKQFSHIWRYPKDLLFLPAYLLVTTFVLTPVEWIGNLTLRESSWLTRNTDEV